MHLDLATFLNLISTAAIVGALIFTARQVRAATDARREGVSIMKDEVKAELALAGAVSDLVSR